MFAILILLNRPFLISDFWPEASTSSIAAQNPYNINSPWSQYMNIPKLHDDVNKWKHFPRYWPFVRGIYRWPVNSPHKGQRHGALMFSLIYGWINAWVNNREAGDLRHHRAHYDVIVMLLRTAVLGILRISFTATGMGSLALLSQWKWRKHGLYCLFNPGFIEAFLYLSAWEHLFCIFMAACLFYSL